MNAHWVKAQYATAVSLSLCLALSSREASAADTYPTKPVKVIVAFSAGGPSDLAARQIGQLLSTRLDQQFVIENRPGASGAIGTKMAATAAPDGYTLHFCNTPTHSVNPA